MIILCVCLQEVWSAENELSSQCSVASGLKVRVKLIHIYSSFIKHRNGRGQASIFDTDIRAI